MTTQTIEVPKVVILKNDYDEYQVPAEHGDWYYTDDRDDAKATAMAIWGSSINITYRRIAA